MDLIKITRALADDLHALRRPAGVSHVYNPLRYMWPAHERFLSRHYIMTGRLLDGDGNDEGEHHRCAVPGSHAAMPVAQGRLPDAPVAARHAQRRRVGDDGAARPRERGRAAAGRERGRAVTRQHRRRRLARLLQEVVGLVLAALISFGAWACVVHCVR